MKTLGILVAVCATATLVPSRVVAEITGDTAAGEPATVLEGPWLDATLGRGLRRMSALGIAAALEADASPQYAYTKPMSGGALVSVSYAPEVSDPRFSEQLRVVLEHSAPWGADERYAVEMGGSARYARGVRLAPGLRIRDLVSIRGNAALVIAGSLKFEAAIRFDRQAGVESRLLRLASAETPADNSVTSATSAIEYRRGPWTIGAFGQWATSGGEVLRGHGVSVAYRSARFTVFGACYRYRLEGTIAGARPDEGAVIAGIRFAPGRSAR